MTPPATLSPAMAQYKAQKERHPNALLFFRMGDFYELFFEDAKTAANDLSITLTSRGKGENAIPMAGVPVRAIDDYLQKLVQMGHHVAICEQMQEASEAKGVVDRAVVRVVTPGTLTEDNLLRGSRANYLAAISIGKERVGIAWVELSTGAFLVHECPIDRLADEISRIEPAELLLAEELRGETPWLPHAKAPVTWRPGYDFGADGANRALLQFFKVGTLAGFGVTDMPLAIGAAGALITYLQDTQLCALPHLHGIEVFTDGSDMQLDRATRQSLELVQTMRDDEGTPLLSVLDRTSTPMGARLLRNWLLAPLANRDAIVERQTAVAEAYDDPNLLRLVRDALAPVLDLERLTSRAAFGRANARDLAGLCQSLEQLPDLIVRLRECQSEAFARLALMDPVPELAAEIKNAIVDEPPTAIRDGGMFRTGFHRELDEMRVLARDSNAWLARYQQQLAKTTGIPSLKIGFNNIFGYYIEVTHTHRDVDLPADFQRKQTMKNAERYVTAELRTFETKVLKAEEEGKALEYQLFCELRQKIADACNRLQATARAIGELDVLCALAVVAGDRDYCRPTIDDSTILHIEEGRHPVLETTHAAGTFVANDTDLDPTKRRLVLLTGPNMAGKSTWIRQNALITIMAQIGSFVPAKSAHIGVVDRVFTRVGAADDISRGASTFMVEMTETANILNNATDRSLVILDEVGRGTSTYDGLSLAWAIAEELLDVVRCRTLFATHYHQLVDLAAPDNGVANCRVAVREWGDEIVFLHHIEPGSSDRSYGLHVAALAGIPKTVLDRATAVLHKLEAEGDDVRESLVTSRQRNRPGPRQAELFSAPPDPLIEELAKLDLDDLTPRQAHELLQRWQEQNGQK